MDFKLWYESANSFLEKDCPFLCTHPRFSQATCSLYLWNMVKSLSTSWEGRNVLEDKSHQGSSTASLWLLWIPLSYVSHHCVFIYALVISPNTSSLVSCFCHCFYSLSWHFSQDFISHCLFQLLKFLSPACWGFGCIWEMIRILRTARGSSRFPFPFLFGDSGDVRVLSFLGGQPAAAGLGLSLVFCSGCSKPDEMLGSRVLLYL